jgi:hypothetical protein
MSHPGFVSAAVLAATIALRVQPVGAAPAPGTILGPDTWRQAEGLLPPEVLRHYESGGYVNPILEWPAERFNWPPDFQNASKANEGRYEIDAEGAIVDKTTDRQPDLVFGFPFPTIDPKDPKAGAKIMWNHLYRTYYFGNLRAESQLNMLSASGLTRRIDSRGGAGPEPAELPLPEPRAREEPGRRERHRGAHLALPGSDETGLGVDLRACAPARARDQPDQPLRRLPGLRSVPGRRSLLRWKARGLHLEAGA